MLEMLMKKRNQKGFTLVEMLIVVAIIAILVAIAVPTFTSQLEKSRIAVDKANARSAESLAVSAYMLNHQDASDVTYTAYTDTNGNLVVVCNVTGCTTCGTATGTELAPKSTTLSLAAPLTIEIKDGAIASNSWSAAISN